MTVGTTSFDAVIEQVLDAEALETLQLFGIRNIILQIGRGKVPEFAASTWEPEGEPWVGSWHGMEVEMHRYVPSLRRLIDQSSMIISHAGVCVCVVSFDSTTGATVNEPGMHRVLFRQVLEVFSRLCAPESLLWL